MKKTFPELFYSSEVAALPTYLHSKIVDYLHELEIHFSLANNIFTIEFKNQSQYENINATLKKIKESNSFLDQLDCFSELTGEDLFIKEQFIHIDDLIPYLESFSSKGIDFNFESSMNDLFAIDCIDYVGFISRQTKNSEELKQEAMGLLWEKATSPLSEDWLLAIGFNSLEESSLSIPHSNTNEYLHVLDFLNSFDYRLSLIEEEFVCNNISKDSFHQKKQQLLKDQCAASKSSFAENFSKANRWMTQQSKLLKNNEDWAGISEVFSFEDFTFFHLLSEKSKDSESSQLQHCVGLGGYDFHSGIYSLRDSSNTAFATIEVDDNGDINQIQGRRNNPPLDSCLPAIRAFCKDFLHKNELELSLIENSGICIASIKILLEEHSKFSYQQYLPYPAEFTSSKLRTFTTNSTNLESIDLEYLAFLQSSDIPQALLSYFSSYLKEKPTFSKYYNFLDFNLKEPLFLVSNSAHNIQSFFIFKEKYSQFIKRDIGLDRMFQNLNCLQEENLSLNKKNHLLLQFEQTLQQSFPRLIDYSKLKDDLLENPSNLGILCEFIQMADLLKKDLLNNPSFSNELSIIRAINQLPGNTQKEELFRNDYFKFIFNETLDFQGISMSRTDFDFEEIGQLAKYQKPCFCRASCLNPTRLKNIRQQVLSFNQLLLKQKLLFQEPPYGVYENFLSIIKHNFICYNEFILQSLKNEDQAIAILNQKLEFINYQLQKLQEIIAANEKSFNQFNEQMRIRSNELKAIIKSLDAKVCEGAGEAFEVYPLRAELDEDNEKITYLIKLSELAEKIRNLNFKKMTKENLSLMRCGK